MLTVSERRACRAPGQHRSTQRKVPRGRDDEAALLSDLIELARRYGRYGYRKIAALLRAAGWLVNDERVERLWRQQGLKVPARQPREGWDCPLGRLRSPDRLRRPSYPWWKGPRSTNIPLAPPRGG